MGICLQTSGIELSKISVVYVVTQVKSGVDGNQASKIALKQPSWCGDWMCVILNLVVGPYLV